MCSGMDLGDHPNLREWVVLKKTGKVMTNYISYYGYPSGKPREDYIGFQVEVVEQPQTSICSRCVVMMSEKAQMAFGKRLAEYESKSEDFKKRKKSDKMFLIWAVRITIVLFIMLAAFFAVIGWPPPKWSEVCLGVAAFILFFFWCLVVMHWPDYQPPERPNNDMQTEILKEALGEPHGAQLKAIASESESLKSAKVLFGDDCAGVAEDGLFIMSRERFDRDGHNGFVLIHKVGGETRMSEVRKYAAPSSAGKWLCMGKAV